MVWDRGDERRRKVELRNIIQSDVFDMFKIVFLLLALGRPEHTPIISQLQNR